MFDAMAARYTDLLADRDMLLGQLQAYAACQEPAVRETVQREYGRLVDQVRETAGGDDERVSRFFATGMLLNVVAAMGAHELDEPWAHALLAPLRGDC
jgi:hypothetical protein